MKEKLSYYTAAKINVNTPEKVYAKPLSQRVCVDGLVLFQTTPRTFRKLCNFFLIGSLQMVFKTSK